ncbi:MAG: hypothetical protein JW783_16145 [Bacteroidales bacterium]|nr:hypothetical protein [Bacteroidales bacterium]MBN2750670.1 hypothetical protein [Bacteroidales bacterium]
MKYKKRVKLSAHEQVMQKPPQPVVPLLPKQLTARLKTRNKNLTFYQKREGGLGYTIQIQTKKLILQLLHQSKALHKNLSNRLMVHNPSKAN